MDLGDYHLSMHIHQDLQMCHSGGDVDNGGGSGCRQEIFISFDLLHCESKLL